jgi:hypothetical protein
METIKQANENLRKQVLQLFTQGTKAVAQNPQIKHKLNFLEVSKEKSILTHTPLNTDYSKN